MKELTKGYPAKVILMFAVPMIFGNILQQLYSMVDGKIVSTYIGTGAFAAVGATSVITNMMTGFINGLTQGFAILISMRFGAGDGRNMRKNVAGTVVLTAIVTVILTVGCLVSIEGVLKQLDTPADIMEASLVYIRIVIAGFVFTALYNVTANILRSVGESRIPLLCLAVAVAVNIGLDILFVKTFGMGIAGAAYATIISQAVSGILCLCYLVGRFKELIPERKEWRPEKKRYADLGVCGLSMAFMSCFVSIGTIVFQQAVNKLGTSIVAAHTAARRIDELLMVPILCVGMAMTTYVGQNVGAEERDRANQGIRHAIICVSVMTTLLIGLCYGAGEPLVRWITNTQEPEIIMTAVRYLKINILFFYTLGPLFVLRCSLQGMGYKVIPLISSIMELVVKIIATRVFVPIHGYVGVIYTEPVSWILMTIILTIGYAYAKQGMLFPSEDKGSARIE